MVMATFAAGMATAPWYDDTSYHSSHRLTSTWSRPARTAVVRAAVTGPAAHAPIVRRGESHTGSQDDAFHHHPVLLRLRIPQCLSGVDSTSEAGSTLRLHRRSRADPLRRPSRRPRPARSW